MRQAIHALAQANLIQRQGDAAMAEFGSDRDCQQVVDTKAFTGRGRALRADLDRIHVVMEELATISKAVPGRSFYLSVHRRASTGQHSLRWRNVSDNTHLPWERMPALFAAQLPSLAAWYVALQERVMEINQDECMARRRLRRVEPRVLA